MDCCRHSRPDRRHPAPSLTTSSCSGGCGRSPKNSPGLSIPWADHGSLQRTPPEGFWRPSHSVVLNNSRSRCTPHSRCSAHTRYRPRIGCRRCMPGMPRIPGRLCITQSTDWRSPRRCRRCPPSLRPRRCRRCPPSLRPRRCLRSLPSLRPRRCLRSLPIPRPRRCLCWLSSPQRCHCRRRPPNPTELPWTPSSQPCDRS